MSDFIEQVLSHKFVMIMGKGGVGKSTIATTLAKLAVQQGKRVWLVENSHTESLAPNFGLEAIGPEEVEIEPGLTLSNLEVGKCFENYVLRTLRSKMLYHLVFNNRLVDIFIEALPGFDEILYLTELLNACDPDYRGSRPVYDLVIFDSAATGHGINVLKTALTLMEMVQQGPVNQLSSAVHKKLTDKSHSLFVPVTLAEEMPISETLEMQAQIAESMEVQWSPIIVNAVAQSELSPTDWEQLNVAWTPANQAETQLQTALKAQSSLCHVHNTAIDEMRQRTDRELIVIPRIGVVGHTETSKQAQGLQEIACHLKNS